MTEHLTQEATTQNKKERFTGQAESEALNSFLGDASEDSASDVDRRKGKRKQKPMSNTNTSRESKRKNSKASSSGDKSNENRAYLVDLALQGYAQVEKALSSSSQESRGRRSKKQSALPLDTERGANVEREREGIARFYSAFNNESDNEHNVNDKRGRDKDKEVRGTPTRSVTPVGLNNHRSSQSNAELRRGSRSSHSLSREASSRSRSPSDARMGMHDTTIPAKPQRKSNTRRQSNNGSKSVSEASSSGSGPSAPDLNADRPVNKRRRKMADVKVEMSRRNSTTGVAGRAAAGSDIISSSVKEITQSVEKWIGGWSTEWHQARKSGALVGTNSATSQIVLESS